MASAGIGALAKVPWAAITVDKHIGRKLGLDIAYLFKPDMSGVYLSLRVFFYQELQDKYGKFLPIYIKNRSNHIRDFLAESNKLRDDLLIGINLENGGQFAKIYSLGTVIAKYYDAENIPSTEDLVSDVNYFIDTYRFILENYTEKTDISLDEWVEVLSNKDVIDCKMYSILEIMNDFEDKSALSSQIAEKRKELGFNDEKSYNSTIVNNSRRVKEYLDKEAIYGDDGKEIFWMRFFYGEKLKEGFKFKLKDELIEALERVDRDIKDEGEDCMAKEYYDSFYDYLIDKEYLFDKEIIENYLLSLKVKPFAILTGNSGTGKTKLSQLFAQYLNDSGQKNKNKINSISTEVLVGKSSNSGGWALNKNDLKDLIPIDELENNYSILVDGIPAKGNLQMSPRLFYKGNELKHHLEELAEEDEKQKVPLEILLDKSIESTSDEGYITFKTNNARLTEDFFGLGKKTVNALLGLDKYEGTIDAYFDDNKSNEQLTLNAVAGTWDKELINHLRSIDDLSEIEIKINKKDIANTFLDQISIGHKDIISFERKMGETIFWCLPKKELNNFLPVKNKYTWNAIVDGMETKIDFWIHIVCVSLYPSENESLLNYLNKKGENDTLKIKVDLSTFEPHGKEYDYGVSFIDGVDEKLIEKTSNYKIIPVGANWTENRNIVGYYNVITNEYQSTPAYDLIQQANNYKEPHFLILDEMNLSHVERYFADFLSAIESGEKIPLYGEEELSLPQNLFIIGTVNVDETTYMFSPKVLDRANVIEFETYSASDYMNNRINLNSPDGNISYLENPLAGNEIRDYGIDELRDFFEDVTVDGEPFWNLLTEEIFSFQNILKESGFDFGFRVINEIVRFMAVAWEYENKPEEFANWTRYFDACIKQKMLPKLHGSEKIIGETLEKLYKKCLSSTIDKEEMAKYPESYKKLKEMKIVLNKQRYVSFIN